jgi:hypothetical protein
MGWGWQPVAAVKRIRMRSRCVRGCISMCDGGHEGLVRVALNAL